MIVIDGAEGEGGGQIVRSSLALSALTGKPVTLENIRAGRKKQGLLRQHLTAVEAAQEICSAQTTGAALKSTELIFEPGPVRPGNYRFQVGTAGSTTLVAQTVLPPLLCADGDSTLAIQGGTHNPWAPCYDFLAQTYLPLVANMGPTLTSQIHAHGFYPAGGGEISITIKPCEYLQPLEILDRGRATTPKVTAIISDLSRSIGQRECDVVTRKMGWASSKAEIQEVVNPRGPGNVILIALKGATHTEIFTGFGAAGVRAEQVARNVLKEARAYLAAAPVPVGEYLADQLLLPAGVAAQQGKTSRFLTLPLSQHSLTHIQILQRFLDIDITAVEDGRRVTVTVQPHRNDQQPNP